MISVYMVLSCVPAIQKIGLFRFLFGTRWASTAADPAYGILPFIRSSVYGTLGATVIGVPFGLLTAVFLSKAAGPKVRTVVVTAIELLSGIPSVVFGLLGMLVLVPAV
ncbi:phosphate ABC transporter permease subunit PstC, partial [Faecalibacterium sp. DFI.5.82]|nr:phosphate ABC transporter permease subunit PstC [Faecalibacterium sp. DFI.5.82]